MDKKNFLLGLTCLGLAFGLMIHQEKTSRTIVLENAKAQAVKKDVQQEGTLAQPTKSENEPLKTGLLPQKILGPEQTVCLENEVLRVYFTNHGGAIRAIELKKYSAEKEKDLPYVFNQGTELPALSLSFSEPIKDKGVLQNYELVQKTKDFVQFVLRNEEGLEIVRGYRLSSGKAANPYLIRHETSIKKSSEKSLATLQNLYINLGAFPATPGDSYGEYLNFGSYDGKKAEFIKTRDFASSNGFLGLGKREGRPFVREEKRLLWGSIKNQFFTAILTPEERALGSFAQAVEIKQNGKVEEGINAHLIFDLGQNGKIFSMDYYVGPKDYLLLHRMGEDQDLVMQFGFFGAVSKVLLLSMLGIHSFIPNWGWTIIVLTLIIKLLMWPLTQAQLHSSKRMASIQGPLREVREKFKNNPQKIQMETMKLFKENKVNPAMGCLPLLIQLPIFLGLYFMLRTSSEMRFQSFLWIKDLSIPDTIAHLGSFPVNILPLLMGVTMFIQMRVTPTPTTDNVQQKMLQWMPFLFLIFCYSFPAALVLYWTVQNVLTIAQQFISNRCTKGIVPAGDSPLMVETKKSSRKKHLKNG